MQLTKIDLSAIVAIAHNEDFALMLLVERGKGQLELVEVSAPIQAFQGIKEIAQIVSPVRQEKLDSIIMQEVKSSTFRAIGYAPDLKILQVDFNGGTRYRYKQVPPETFQRFVNAESKGQFYNREVKEFYPFEKV